MPNYVFICNQCHKRFEVYFSYAEYGVKVPVCLYCQSTDVTRKIGAVRIGRSDRERLQNLADPKNLETLDDDPRSLGKMMRQMSSELGEDMGGEFNDVVNRLEAGQSPEQIERDLPELSSGEDSSPFSGSEV